MYKVSIDFCNPENKEEVLTLNWKLMDHEAAIIWFKLYIELMNTSLKYFTRFTGFVNGHKNMEFMANRMNECIQIINDDGHYHIKEKATVNFTQEFSNIIHHHFEILSGGFDNPSEYILTRPPRVTRAVAGLNYYVHDMEAYTRNLEARKSPLEDYSFSGVVVEVKDCKRIKYPDSFDSLITTDINFGDLVAHYSQIGKTWLEAYYDKDEDIFDNAILPHYALSGEFDVMFGKFMMNENEKNKFHDFLKSKGKNPFDPKLRIGHLKLAELENQNQLTNKEFKDNLAKFCEIKNIRALKDDLVLKEKNIFGSTNLFF